MTKPNHPDRSHNPNDEHRVLVHGAIQTYSSPEAEQKHDAERKEDTTTHVTERQEDRRRETYKIWLERGTLLAVVIYAGIAWWQGCLTREIITQNHDNFVKDQAPYIWFTPKEIIMNPGEQIAWQVQYSNYGRSPALSVHTCMRLVISNAGFAALDSINTIQEVCDVTSSSVTRSTDVTPPGIVGYSSPSSPVPVSKLVIDALKQLDGGVYVMGVAHYKDRSGNSYESVFCSLRLATGADMHCGKFNYIRRIQE